MSLSLNLPTYNINYHNMRCGVDTVHVISSMLSFRQHCLHVLYNLLGTGFLSVVGICHSF